MVIVAYLMGIENYSLKEILSTKRTLEILNDYQGNYDQFCAKITLEQIN